MMKHKPCYGKCERCIWRDNGGCSEWNGWGGDDYDQNSYINRRS